MRHHLQNKFSNNDNDNDNDNASNHGKKFNREKKQKPIKNPGRTKDVKEDNARNLFGIGG